MPNLKRFAPGEMRRRIAEEFSSKIEEIARSPLFHAAELIVRKYNVSLSQACALLWRDWFTGDVEGLWTNSSRLAALYACNILELMALGKISCELQGEVDKRKIKLKVLNRDVTNSYLDQAGFFHIMKMERSGQDISLHDCFLQAIKFKLWPRRNCASLTLESMHDMKILRRDKECWGLNRLYRTVNLEPYALLEKEMRLIVLKSKSPDCCMRILLTFLNMADSYVPKRNKILKRFFTKNEYPSAVERIRTLASEWRPLSYNTKA